MNRIPALALGLTLGVTPVLTQAYPLDGYADTGIRRLEASRLANEGAIRGPRQPAGALLATGQVDLRLLDHPNLDLPPADPAFTAQIVRLLGGNADSYGIAVLDLSDPANPRYAEHRGDYKQNVGSVGKLVVALAIFQALADIWPDEADRIRVLQETVITADEFSHWDHHTVRMFDVAARQLTRRAIKDGDQATLWEYLDWMLSPSSNSAAGMLMRDAMLMRQYGTAYPPAPDEIQRFFAATPKSELTALFEKTFFEPLVRNGFDLEFFRQASFFTRQGKNKVPGPGASYATARELMKYGLRLEQGRLVDEFSSRQIKRLIYVTENRIRYASSPQLRDSAVYFKSGSLYSCREEAGFACGKYKGNVKNYMNSFAMIESPAGERRLHYMVMLISNVLRKNSAYDHQTLATQIHQLIDQAHPAPTTAAAAPQGNP
ncbi:MAG: hypothetical protein RLZ44_1535 [Pseudomonadota bacterium]|jgi:hypothetical protein